MRLARRSSIIAFCLVLTTCAHAKVPAEESRSIENVLFIVSDDLKASVLGCYGDKHCQTPNIDRLAKTGMVFEQAFCQAAHCGPSRDSFMHGRYQGLQGFSAEQKSSTVNLGQHFKENGRYSARVGKIYHMRVPGDIIAGTDGLDVASSWTERFNSSGLEAHTPGDYACLNLNIFTDALEDRQSTQMPHRMFVTVQYDGDGSDQPDSKSASTAIELLRTKGSEPFFLAVGFVRPHYPMVAPRQYFQPYPWNSIEMPEAMEDDLADIPEAGIASTVNTKNSIGKYPDNQKRMWSGYYASVTFMDDQVGKLLDELERLGLREKTAVVFLSDHGYHLGEHGFWQKANLHEEIIRVPLIISAPGLPAGRTQSIVELVDIFPTLADLAHLPVPETVQGTSLVPILRDPAAGVKESALTFHKGTSYRTPDWHYMKYPDGMSELYRRGDDPNEFRNLAALPEYAGEVAKIDADLNERLGRIDLEP